MVDGTPNAGVAAGGGGGALEGVDLLGVIVEEVPPNENLGKVFVVVLAAEAKETAAKGFDLVPGVVVDDDLIGVAEAAEEGARMGPFENCFRLSRVKF